MLIRPKSTNKNQTHKFKTVEIHPELREHLLRWRDAWERLFEERRRNGTRGEVGDPHDWVFFHPHRPNLRAKGFGRAFRQARETAGLPWLTMKTLRHYFVSNALMKGVDIFTVSRWVGHSSTKMIEQTYGHLSGKFRAEQMAKLTIEAPRGDLSPEASA